MTTVEVLRVARARIDFGWVQGTKAVLSENTNHCCVSATTGITDIPSIERRAERFVRAALDVKTDHELLAWNDRRGRTKDEVLALFDKAIALAEAESAP